MTYLELQQHVEQQIENCLCCKIDVSRYIIPAVKRTHTCIQQLSSKYQIPVKNQEIPFSVFHSVQYCIFLYHMSAVSFEMDHSGEHAEKFYYLNKIMHAIDLFYAIKLPRIWGMEHPLGSVMGRAKYSDFFFFYQGCTVGGNKGIYPTLGHHVVMYSNSKILGSAQIGNHVVISANTYIKDETIPDNSLVFGQSPYLIIKQKSEDDIKKITNHIWRYDSMEIDT